MSGTHPFFPGHRRSPGFEDKRLPPNIAFPSHGSPTLNPEWPCTHACGDRHGTPSSVPLCAPPLHNLSRPDLRPGGIHWPHSWLWEDRPGEPVSQALEASSGHLRTESQGPGYPRCSLEPAPGGPFSHSRLKGSQSWALPSVGPGQAPQGALWIPSNSLDGRGPSLGPALLWEPQKIHLTLSWAALSRWV